MLKTFLKRVKDRQQMKKKPVKEFSITELKVNTQLFEILDRNTKDSLRSLIGHKNKKDFPI